MAGLDVVGVGEAWRSRKTGDVVTVSDVWTRSGVVMVRAVYWSGMMAVRTEQEFRKEFERPKSKRVEAPPQRKPVESADEL